MLTPKRAGVLALGLVVLGIAAVLVVRALSAPKADRATLLYFRSDRCSYCKEMSPVVADIRRRYRGRLEVVYVNLDREEGESVARQYSVVSTPTLLLLDGDGRQISVLRGTLPRTVIEQAIRDSVAR